LGYVPFLVLYKVLEGLSNVLVLFHEFLKCLFNGTQDSTIDRDYGQRIGIGVGNIALLEGNVSGICKGMAIKDY